MFEIIDKIILNKYTSKMTLKAPYIANSAKAGQFVIIRIDDKGERIPLTIADFDDKKGTIDIIYQKVGFTTRKLDNKNKGESILDVVGPLGQPSNLTGYKNALLVVGGSGCAIAYPQAKALSMNNAKVGVICGFRNKDFIILEKELSSISDSFDILTDDGSNSRKGLVTDALLNRIKIDSTIDLVISVGPLPMMKAVCNITRPFRIKTIVSMNTIMIDGTGMCGGCRLTVGGKTKFACIDGPDFDGHDVDFDEAILKSKVYLNTENFLSSSCHLSKNFKSLEGEKIQINEKSGV